MRRVQIVLVFLALVGSALVWSGSPAAAYIGSVPGPPCKIDITEIYLKQTNPNITSGYAMSDYACYYMTHRVTADLNGSLVNGSYGSCYQGPYDCVARGGDAYGNPVGNSGVRRISGGSNQSWAWSPF